ncbi:Transcription factor [Cardamine amara subsp. amara]|uniref:Transcription factor n=1 Tax=Cardamine amara subsp. amara TaxID=228776 RepID=A0ABD1AG38_CARAN
MFHNRPLRPLLPRPLNWFGDINARWMKQNLTQISRRGNWTLSEDLEIIKHVEVFGTRKWKLIEEKIKGRNYKSCRMRWFNQLDPKINKSAFTDEEEEKLIEAHKEFGNKWTKIAKLFNGRTDNAVKNHWHILNKRNFQTQTTYNKKKRLPSYEPVNLDFDTHLNQQSFNLFPGNASEETKEINNYIWKIPNEEATNLKEVCCSSSMPMQYSGHHFSTFPANSLALFTPHGIISQPSSSSLPSSSLSSSQAEDATTTKPPRFIDFLGVGSS